MKNVEFLEQLARDALLERNLDPDFSESALEQLRRIEKPAGSEQQNVYDRRDLLWCSIDNDDSRDLDQLTYAEEKEDRVVVYVAVADVDALVHQDTPLDIQASINTTSIYTAGKMFPMIPEKLSTDLTSLNENQERIAVIFEMVISWEGILEEYKIYRGLVVNHAKLTYSAVGAWLEEKEKIPEKVVKHRLEKCIKLQDKIAQAIKAKRQSHGALTLQTIELKALYNQGVLVKMEPTGHNRAHELIENLMIITNTASARYMVEHSIPSLRRVVREPERWDRIQSLAKEHGEILPGRPDSGALDRFLVKMQQRNPEIFPDISLTVVKLLGSGEYVVEVPGDSPIGHFGLALRQYSHSTAPNRRYPDLITQRLLKASILKMNIPYKVAELELLATHCTEQEDLAAKAERQVAKSAAAMLLSGHINEKFDAIVTGASAKGTWIRLYSPPIEGKLITGKKNLDIGDHVRVKLVNVDIPRGFIDFVQA